MYFFKKLNQTHPNVDEVTSERGRKSSIGVIIRDFKGEVAAGFCRLLLGNFCVLETEALAMEAGVLLAKELGLQQIIIESDSLLVVQNIAAKEVSGETCHIIQGILSSLDCFSRWQIKHVKRDFNRVAHELALYAKCKEISQAWEGCSSSIVRHLIHQDCLWWYSYPVSHCTSSVLFNESLLIKKKKKSYMHPWLWYGFHSIKYVPNQVYLVKGTWIPSHFPKLWDLWAWTTKEKGDAWVQKILLELLCVVNCLVADLTKKMIQSSFIEERHIGLCLFFSPEAIVRPTTDMCFFPISLKHQ